jgi:transposase InsO family protein
MEQRYQAVLEVQAGVPVVDVAERFGVSRQAVHRWRNRYQAGGLEALADRSKRPRSSPWQVPAEVEALVCEMRRTHPRWGPRRIRAELVKRPEFADGSFRVPHRSSIYRILVRFDLLTVKPRRRKRSEYKRWQRDAPMELWQLDIVGSCFLTDGRELKVVTGVDDHSRYCVIAAVVPRATARAVCTAFVQALRAFGCPQQVLTDNGKQFTGRFGKPRSAEVLFERICRRNGIETILTKPRSPTTTGKVERFHQTLQADCFTADGPFPDVAAAQAAVDAFRAEYNHDRPHQALDDAPPASRFVPVPQQVRAELGLDIPAELLNTLPTPVTGEAEAAADNVNAADLAPVGEVDEEQPQGFLTGDEHWLGGQAIELERTVSSSGNVKVGPQQFWIGPAHAGRRLRFWMDTTTVHLSLDGVHLKTVPSRQTTVSLTRLRAAGAHPAGAPPRRAIALPRTSGDDRGYGVAVEVDRVVNASGLVALSGRYVSVGQALAGRRITLRLEGELAHVIDDGVLVRTLPAPVPTALRRRLHGVRLAGSERPVPAGPLRIQRRVSGRGVTQVAGQRLRVGFAHRHTLVDVDVLETEFHVHDQAGETLAVIPRAGDKEVTRTKGYGVRDRIG